MALRYALGSGQLIVPRSRSEAHLREALPEALQGIHFSAAELLLLRSLDGHVELAQEQAP